MVPKRDIGKLRRSEWKSGLGVQWHEVHSLQLTAEPRELLPSQSNRTRLGPNPPGPRNAQGSGTWRGWDLRVHPAAGSDISSLVTSRARSVVEHQRKMIGI